MVYTFNFKTISRHNLLPRMPYGSMLRRGAGARSTAHGEAAPTQHDAMPVPTKWLLNTRRALTRTPTRSGVLWKGGHWEGDDEGRDGDPARGGAAAREGASREGRRQEETSH